MGGKLKLATNRLNTGGRRAPTTAVTETTTRHRQHGLSTRRTEKGLGYGRGNFREQSCSCPGRMRRKRAGGGTLLLNQHVKLPTRLAGAPHG